MQYNSRTELHSFSTNKITLSSTINSFFFFSFLNSSWSAFYTVPSSQYLQTFWGWRRPTGPHPIRLMEGYSSWLVWGTISAGSILQLMKQDYSWYSTQQHAFKLAHSKKASWVLLRNREAECLQHKGEGCRSQLQKNPASCFLCLFLCLSTEKYPTWYPAYSQ